MAEGRGKKFSILKYFLMSSNAFGLMIGIFLVLFGMAYPEEDFPGGYKGRETAIIAGVFMFFTLIGYCGAHHQKIYALILYSFIILVFIGGNVILWGVKPEFLVLDPESRTVYFVCGLFLILMVIGVVLSWQIRSRAMLACQESSPQEQTTSTSTSATHHKINNNQPSALPASSSYIHMVTRSGPTQQIPISYQ